MAKTPQERMAELEAQMARIKERRDRIAAGEKTKERKADTRRKVILGGLLLDRAGRNPKVAALVNQMIGEIIREADKAAFQGWEPPAPDGARPAPAAPVAPTE